MIILNIFVCLISSTLDSWRLGYVKGLDHLSIFFKMYILQRKYSTAQFRAIRLWDKK